MTEGGGGGDGSKDRELQVLFVILEKNGKLSKGFKQLHDMLSVFAKDHSAYGKQNNELGIWH